MFFSLGNVGIAKTLGFSSNQLKEGFAEVTPGRVLENFKLGSAALFLGLIIGLCLLVQYAGMGYGLWVMFSRKQYIPFLLITFTAIYFALVTGVEGMYRYRLPVTPFICVAAGYGYALFFKRRKEKENN
jgi:hypothetical protein